jgi:hypothetical protein
MRLIRRFAVSRVEILFLACVAAGCAGGDPPSGGSSQGGTGGSTAGSTGTGGSRSGGKGGSGGSGGTGAVAGGSGGSGGSVTTTGGAGGGGGSSGTGGSIMSDASGGSSADATGGSTSDAKPAPDTSSSGPDTGPSSSNTPMEIDGMPKPSYAGEIPIYYGPEVGPKVEMNCPEDPTVGWTEYQDSFNVQRPYNMPINTRFSIKGGIYNFWVFPNDAPHSPTANGRNPRTEARYGGTADVATGKNFQTGNRMWSGDMLIERNAVNSAIFQIHTTADGGGPIGLRVQSNGDMVNNGSLTVVQGSSVPGGTVDKWFNFKASLNADTQEVKIYINNCLKSTYKGPRGDGNFYFKHGVYFCKTSQNGCFSHYKNIHLYKK